MTACLFTLVSCDNIPNEDPAEARKELIEEEDTVVDGKSSASKYGFSGLVTSIHAYKEYDSVTIFYFEDGILGKNESQSFSKSYVVGYIIHGARNDYMFCLPIIMPVVLYIILVACLLNLSLYPLLFYIIFVVWGIFSDLKKIYSFIFKARKQI